MPDVSTNQEMPPLAQAGLFFAIAFIAIQGAAFVLQSGVTLPAAVTAFIAAATGAWIVYSYDTKRQAGGFDPPAPTPDSEEAAAPKEDGPSSSA